MGKNNTCANDCQYRGTAYTFRANFFGGSLKLRREETGGTINTSDTTRNDNASRIITGLPPRLNTKPLSVHSSTGPSSDLPRTLNLTSPHTNSLDPSLSGFYEVRSANRFLPPRTHTLRSWPSGDPDKHIHISMFHKSPPG